MFAACGDDALGTRMSPLARAQASSAEVSMREPTPPVRFVRLEQISEANGKAWASMAEFNLIDSTGATVPRNGWKVSADSADSNDAASHAIDGNPASMWHTQWSGASPPPPHHFTIDMGQRVRLSGLRYLPRQDSLVNGNIARYRLLVSNDGIEWSGPVASGDFSTMGAPKQEKTVVFARQTANHAPRLQAPATQTTALHSAVLLRIEANDADADALHFTAIDLPPGLGIGASSGVIAGTPIAAGRYRATLTVRDGKGGVAQAALEWTIAAAADSAGDRAGVASGSGVRYAKLEQLSEVNGKPWASMAEFYLLDASGAALPRNTWTVSADSADTADAAANAIDGNAATLWHTHWDGDAPPPPHSFIVDLHANVKVGGFRYLPRQDSIRNGSIARYRFYVSADGTNWGSAVAEGDLSTLGPPTAEKTVRIK